ncbi:arylacetamide deacetylase [Amylocarpus encephaloides]|uniref:Arylacetamide deacetylase n=1 Tax=Amylocarpus encephaloides TaxID=45428 RepID=A0A9P8C5S7_9HELO|nr:arylacetamide deacetylase [Amylocarpus encephaloides]
MANSTEGFAKPWLDFEKQIGQRLLLTAPTAAEARAQYLETGALLMSKLTFPAPDTSITTTDKEIQPGLKVRIYTPPDRTFAPKPACIFYHGGGWAMGDLEGEDGFCRMVSKECEVVVVSVDYRLAPEYPYPAPLDDCVEVYEWVLKNSEELGTKSGEIVTVGTSAGGNLALAVALKMLDSGKGETVKGIVALAPVTVAVEALPESLRGKYTSYDDHDLNTINTKAAMKMFFDAYRADPKDPYVSVLLHQKLCDLPRVYIAVCGQDTLRDDGRLMRDTLNEAGVPNMYDEYEGYPHFFWSYPSEHLKGPIGKFKSNVRKGVEFVLEA